MSKILLISSILGFIAITVLWLYVFENGTGHTGINPNLLYFIFIPLMLLGLLKRKKDRLAMLAIGVAILGVTSLVYLDQTNTLLEYEIWIERGMPSNVGEV